MRTCPPALLILALLIPFSAAHADRPRTGLVLSGGGAKGAAHIGVLKVLDELRVPIDAVAGTSMGSLVGGAFAAGLPVAEMERQVTQVDWNALFTDDPARKEWPARRKEESYQPTWDFTVGLRNGKLRLPPGALAGQKVLLFLSNLTKGAETIADFDRLPVPFRAVATDLRTGEMKVFDRGSLPLAMRASMAVPGVFAPLQLDGEVYVDGGLVRNTPVDVARSMGVDRLIVVRLGADPPDPERLTSIVGIAGQMVNILISQNEQASLAEMDPRRDLLIEPNLGKMSSGDFNEAAYAIARGEEAARAATSELAAFAVDEAEYLAWRDARFGPGRPVARVADVRVEGLDRVNPELFEPLAEAVEGQPLDRKALEGEIETLYGRGDFERVSYRFDTDAQGSLLIVDALEKGWGPNYFSVGLGLKSDSNGDHRFGLRGTYRQTWVNRLGAEWSTGLVLGNQPSLFTEFFQPLSLDRSAFVAPYAQWSDTPVGVFVDDRRVARFDVTRLQAGLDVGTTLAYGTEARIGAYFRSTDFSVDTGSTLLPEERSNESGARVRFLYDTLDSPFIPRSGMRVALEATRALDALGADEEFTRAQLRWTGAASRGPNTLTTDLQLGSSFGDTLPYYDQFPMGGFLQLSGYANEQFRGETMALGTLAYYRRIAELAPPVGRGVYVGGSLEGGRLWDVVEDLNPSEWRYGGSVFLAADTWLGPFSLALGLSGEGDAAVYVLLGTH